VPTSTPASPTGLLTRAVELLRPHRLELALELEAALATVEVDGRAAVKAAHTVAERAEAAGDRSGAMLARAMALFLRGISGELGSSGEPEALCRAALPFEEERADPRRLALLWSLMAYAAHWRMRNDESVSAFERALGYFRLVGDSASSVTVELDWALILSPRAADEGLRMLDELAPGRPPGDGDLARAVLLAQLGRFDEAWRLAEARSDHLREVTGGVMADGHLAVIAMLEGDRQRACQYHVNLIDALPPGSDGTAATWRLPLARDLCYLGRFGEAERELRQAQAVAASPVERALAPAVEALLLAARGELEQAEDLARASIAAAETETDNPWLQGWGYEDLATVLERAGRIEEAREALERAVAVWERKRCLPYVVRLRERIDSLERAKV
jgi:tetratricopeptide (TPR) repeat protein